MMTLQTGLPGHAKTLFILWFIERYRDSENKLLQEEAVRTGAAYVPRVIYYAGIKEVTLDGWVEFDPTKWMDLPFGSIIFIDEAQDVFPVMPNGATLPEFYKELAKHRHRGFDMFFATQHPTLIHNFVRRLCGRHFYSVRKFGMARSTIYEWDKVVDAPDQPAKQKAAINTIKWKFAREYYGTYKSAEVHTVRRAIPAKLVLAVLFVISMVFVFYFALDHYQGRGKGASSPSESSASAAASSSSPGAFASSGSSARIDPVADARDFVFRTTPRVDGLAHTAPKYDQLTKPVRVPVPAMCIRRGDVCRCFSQQGTYLQVPTNMCLEISHSGYFQEFDPDGTVAVDLRHGGDRQPAPATPVDFAPAVAVIPYAPEPSRYAGAVASK